MDIGLDGRVVLVTGGSSGIGRSAAKIFAAEGAKVAVTYSSSAAAASDVVDEIVDRGGEATAVAMHLDEVGSIRAAVEVVVRKWGGIDSLVSNAVQWEEHPPDGSRQFEDVPRDEWQRLLRANVEGTFDLVAAVLPSMRERGNGRIVFTSSGVADEGMAGGALVYAAAKAAIQGFARSLSWDLAASGILVNVLAAGMTSTEHSSATFPPAVRERMSQLSILRRISTPEEVSAWLVLLASAWNTSITGEIIREGTSTTRSPHGGLRP